MRRATSAAAAADPNNPKQVAPEPDMRASRQLGDFCRALSTSAMIA